MKQLGTAQNPLADADARKTWTPPVLTHSGCDILSVKNTTQGFGNDGTPSFSTS